MNEQDINTLAFKAEVQKKVISSCIRNLHGYFKSRKWELLAHKFRTLGYQLPNDLISCKICDDDAQGYYFYKQKKVVICANNVLDKDFDTSLTTNLINAFDDVRAEIDPTNPIHVACSAIRGHNLSGKCATPGILPILRNKMGYAKCVRDNAARDLMRNKNFKLEQEEAEKLVQEIWDTCYYDYEPYNLQEFRKVV